MLPDPFEKELHLPEAFVKLRKGHGRQGEDVGPRSLMVAEMKSV